MRESFTKYEKIVMFKNENIICISSIDWDFIWQGHQEIMAALAQNGNRVLFIENTGVRALGIKDAPRIKNRIKNWFKGVKGIRKEMENLYIFSPIVLPFPYSRFARWVNKRLVLSTMEKWMKVVDFSDPVIWTFLPTPLSLDIIEGLFKKLVVYYCIDDFSVSSISARKIEKSEKILLNKADLVFVTSKALYEKCSKYNDKVSIFPFAVDFDKFEKVRLEDNAISEEIMGIKRPIVGYVGGVHKWINQGLVRALSKACPECSFVFVGPIQTDISILRALKNVHFLGTKDHGRLPLFIKSFDVSIIPYLITDYTKNVYPTKLNEYLAMGKAVVSTALPEVIDFNRKYNDIISIAKDEKDFCEYIKKTISGDNTSMLDKRIEIAKENSWKKRIEEMSDLIEDEIEKRRSGIEVNWKENLIVFYRTARKKMAKIIVACLFFYILLFKTSFVWFLASPLKISDAPRHADAIVVFGGGVGETGGPGNSTIERARYAVGLYNGGYADKIIFSSGYTYIHNDAENMKLLAVSMGVPETDIILEQEANSTYENVIFSKKILDRYNMDSILLVSSPYNMRRASLVFDKWKSKIKVFYTPVENSQFYDRTYGVRIDHIKAILHEYIGMIYYVIKGYT